MSVDKLLPPTPLLVKGYACYTVAEADMARKNIDPAHPKSGPGNREAATDASRPETDAVKLDAARKAAEARQRRVFAYSAEGAPTAVADAGGFFAVKA